MPKLSPNERYLGGAPPRGPDRRRGAAGAEANAPLLRALVRRRSEDLGHHLENLVYLELRRRGEVHGYHLTATGREVDFVAGSEGAIHLVQVCASLGNAATRDREITALSEAMAELKPEAATIITLAEEEQIEAAGRRIRVVPAWRWLLE